MTWLWNLLRTVLDACLAYGAGKQAGRQDTALAEAKAENEHIIRTVQNVEDATAGITDRDTALASLRDRHKPK